MRSTKWIRSTQIFIIRASAFFTLSLRASLHTVLTFAMRLSPLWSFVRHVSFSDLQSQPIATSVTIVSTSSITTVSGWVHALEGTITPISFFSSRLSTFWSSRWLSLASGSWSVRPTFINLTTTPTLTSATRSALWGLALGSCSSTAFSCSYSQSSCFSFTVGWSIETWQRMSTLRVGSRIVIGPCESLSGAQGSSIRFHAVEDRQAMSVMTWSG